MYSFGNKKTFFLKIINLFEIGKKLRLKIYRTLYSFIGKSYVIPTKKERHYIIWYQK